MTMDPQPEPKSPDPFWTLDRLIKLLIFCMACVVITTGILLKQIDSLRDDEARQNIFTLENRAMTCRLQLALEVSLERPCLDEQVVKYYNPEENVSDSFRSNLTDVLCYLAAREGGTFTRACGG